MFLLSSCNKEEEDVNVVPQITFNGVNTTSIQQFSGPLVFTIGYRDGDGDLGENVDGVVNLFIRDRRNNLLYPFRVKSLSPSNGAVVSIQGTIEVEFAPVALTDSVASQTAIFEIYMKDRAGHQSNTVESSVITVTR